MFKKGLVLAVMVTMFAINCYAATINSTWVGGENGSWGQASNWSPAGVPSSADKAYIDTQRFNLMEWETAVAAAVAEGWSREETIERVHFRDKCSVDTGQEYKMDHIQENNAAALYDKLSV